MFTSDYYRVVLEERLKSIIEYVDHNRRFDRSDCMPLIVIHSLQLTFNKIIIKNMIWHAINFR